MAGFAKDYYASSGIPQNRPMTIERMPVAMPMLRRAGPERTSCRVAPATPDAIAMPAIEPMPWAR